MWGQNIWEWSSGLNGCLIDRDMKQLTGCWTINEWFQFFADISSYSNVTSLFFIWIPSEVRFPFKLTLFLSLYWMGGRLPVNFDIMLWWVLPRASIYYKKSCVSMLSEYLFAIWIWSKTARGYWSICVFMRIRLISICFIVK